MRWRGRSGSGNVDDRRGMSIGGIAGGGGVIGIILYLLITFMGGDTSQIQIPSGATQSQAPVDQASDDTLAQFVSVVLAETETTWMRIMQDEGINYTPPVMVLYRDLVESGCGRAGSATGPFYCPADRKLYIDLSFYSQLRKQFGAPGDFAMAYVVAHEVGHHIQNVLGITDQLDGMRNRLSKEQYNQFSVRLELQADYYAGVWAHHAAKGQLLEEGDIEEALKAASAIGDDNLQRQTGSEIRPETFTHGTSRQRMEWFSRGYKFGDLKNGDTFNQPI